VAGSAPSEFRIFTPRAAPRSTRRWQPPGPRPAHGRSTAGRSRRPSGRAPLAQPGTPVPLNRYGARCFTPSR
jgi:hypothetical protein